MYSRDFGGIRSEGQLYNLEREFNESRSDRHEQSQSEALPVKSTPESRRLGLDFLRELKLDDLILIGIALLLLLDSDGENDLFAILIALTVLF